MITAVSEQIICDQIPSQDLAVFVQTAGGVLCKILFSFVFSFVEPFGAMKLTSSTWLKNASLLVSRYLMMTQTRPAEIKISKQVLFFCSLSVTNSAAVAGVPPQCLRLIEA